MSTRKNNLSRGMNAGRIGTILILLLVIALLVFTGCGKKSKAQKEEESVSTALTTTQTTQSETRSTDSWKEEPTTENSDDYQGEVSVREDGTYDSVDDVTAYILAYDKLPPNYITKDEARKLGWSGGSVERYAPGKCIGGDRFGNYEGKLPKGKYTECDIDTLDYKDRGSRRLVFSDTEIYYTHDHYRHFEKICDR